MAAGRLRGDDLAAMFDAAWQLLDDAVADPAAALRWPVVATVGAHGPSGRLMVLRKADRETRTLCFYTDRRAAKVAELTADPRVVITGYDPEPRLQLRLQGTGRLLAGKAVAHAWRQIDESGRRAYATTLPPGSRLDEPGSGLPLEILPAVAMTNFAIMAVVVNQLEWLLLAPNGHRRAHYVYEQAWSGSWRVP